MEQVSKRQKRVDPKVKSWNETREMERIEVTGRDQGCEMEGDCESVKSWMIVAGMRGWNGHAGLTNQWLNRENATGKL